LKGNRIQRRSARRILGRRGNDRHGVRAGLVVCPQPFGDPLGGTQSTHRIKQLNRNCGRELKAARARTGALNQVAKP